MKNPFICHFLRFGNIIDLFNSCIPDPIEEKKYPLIFSEETPQFYFVNYPLDNDDDCKPMEGRHIVGKFSQSDCTDIKFIKSLLKLWKCDP